jgi:hypothetical protein
MKRRIARVRSALIFLALVVVVVGEVRFNETREYEGPVMVPLMAGHGLHLLDLLFLAGGLVLAGLFVLSVRGQ